MEKPFLLSWLIIHLKLFVSLFAGLGLAEDEEGIRLICLYPCLYFLPEENTELKLLASIPTSSSCYWLAALQRSWVEKGQGHQQKGHLWPCHLSEMLCSENTLSESSEGLGADKTGKSCLNWILPRITQCSLAGLAGIPSKLGLAACSQLLGKDRTRGLLSLSCSWENLQTKPLCRV